MPNSPPPPPPPPSTSMERLLGGPKPKEAPPDISALNHMPEQHKKTRELPNLSDCHGCSRRINYSNPNERLQPLDSFWRIALLCKKCRKQVNNGQLCPYCFKDTSKSVSDCYSCANCHRLVHKDCIVYFGNSAPWSYCSNKMGLSFSVCIDCWIPDKLKRSIRSKRGRHVQKDVVLSNPSNGHDKCSGKVSGGGRSSANVAKEAKRALEKKLAVAAKAKEIALRKALAARNAVELASNALNLVATKYPNGKEKETEKEGLVGSSSNGSNSERVGDDAELAFQLHLAMNSSRRLLKKFSPLKFRCLELLKISDSSAKNGKGGHSNPLKNRIHGRNNSLEPNCVANDCCTLTGSGELKPDLITYRHNNRKRKELQESATVASKSYNCTDSYMLKPELVIYQRNSKKRKECQQPSVVEANGSSVYVDSCGVKPESLTHELNNVKMKENQQSDLDVNGSCKLIEFSGLKPEIFTCEQNDGNRKEFQQSGVEAIGSCTLIDSAMPKPELVTHKQNNREGMECEGLETDASGGCSCTDPRGLTPELVTYKRKNNRRKECGQCGECGNLGYADGSVATHTHAEDSSLVRESQSSLQDASKDELCGNDGRLPAPEGCSVDVGAEGRNSISIADRCLLTECKRLTDAGADVFTQDKSGDTNSDRYSLKYSRRRTASDSFLQQFAS